MHFFIKTALSLYLLILCYDISGQNENNKWYFGNNAGLDFTTNPPTILTNGSINTLEGCATVSDAAGNLLFYTDGITVYNKSHVVMANGAGLAGNSSSSQSAIIAKKPGSSNLYYIFTQSGTAGIGAAYSIADMNLAAGMGSLTVKNVTIAANSTEKLTMANHCNGIDIWVIIHQAYTKDFQCYLLTSGGFNITPVVSTTGSSHISTVGCMKTSPNGKKLGLAINTGYFEIFDFDNATGVISNSLALNPNSLSYAYGCEFSQDGSKFYGSRVGSDAYQWDLCAGSNTAIIASRYTIITSTLGIAAMQRASNGKIYGARTSQSILGVINNPNLSGVSCNYVDLGQSIAPNLTAWSLPNFITSYKSPPLPFTFTVNCLNTAFTSSVSPLPNSLCQNSPYSLTSALWTFGDPASGSNNSSSVVNPTHLFSSSGTFTSQVILYYSCGRSNDTVQQAITVFSPPSLTLTGTQSICKGDKRFYTIAGANTYSWSTGNSAYIISVTPTVTTTYTVTGSNVDGCSVSEIFTVTVNNCTGINNQNNFDDQSIFIYPNPAQNILWVEAKTTTFLTLFNLQGLVLLEKRFETGNHTIDISEKSDGVYFIRCSTQSGIETRKLIKITE